MNNILNIFIVIIILQVVLTNDTDSDKDNNNNIQIVAFFDEKNVFSGGLCLRGFGMYLITYAVWGFRYSWFWRFRHMMWSEGFGMRGLAVSFLWLGGFGICRLAVSGVSRGLTVSGYVVWRLRSVVDGFRMGFNGFG